MGEVALRADGVSAGCAGTDSHPQTPPPCEVPLRSQARAEAGASARGARMHSQSASAYLWEEVKKALPDILIETFDLSSQHRIHAIGTGYNNCLPSL